MELLSIVLISVYFAVTHRFGRLRYGYTKRIRAGHPVNAITLEHLANCPLTSLGVKWKLNHTQT